MAWLQEIKTSITPESVEYVFFDSQQTLDANTVLRHWLNNMGQQGYRLVHTVSFYNMPITRYIMERPKQDYQQEERKEESDGK